VTLLRLAGFGGLSKEQGLRDKVVMSDELHAKKIEDRV
jgi:hypothetical protein